MRKRNILFIERSTFMRKRNTFLIKRNTFMIKRNTCLRKRSTCLRKRSTCLGLTGCFCIIASKTCQQLNGAAYSILREDWDVL